MEVGDRECDECGRALEEGDDAQACEPCDAVFCRECLGDRARCPRCRRPFDASPGDAEPGEPRLARGRQQLIAVAVSLVGSVILVAVLGGSPGAALVLQLAVMGLLLVQTFRGRSWARWVLAAITALAALGNGYQALKMLGVAGNPWLVSAGLTVIYVWCVAILVFSAPLRRYLEAQRARYP